MRDRSLSAAECSPAVTGQQPQAVGRFLPHSINHPQHLPEGRTSQKIILFPVGEARGHATLLCRPKSSIVVKPLFGKGTRFPAFHPCRSDRNPVNPAGRIRDVTTNVLEALPPKELTTTRYMVLPFETVSC